MGICNSRVPVVRWGGGDRRLSGSSKATDPTVFTDEGGTLSQTRWKVRIAYTHANSPRRDLNKRVPGRLGGAVAGKRDGASF